MVSYVISGNTDRSVAPETKQHILDAIDKLIDSVDSLSELQKTFLKKIIKLRKELILDAGLNSIPHK